MKKLAVVPSERKEGKNERERENEDVYGKLSSTLVFCSDSELQLEKHFPLDEAASIRRSLSVRFQLFPSYSFWLKFSILV